MPEGKCKDRVREHYESRMEDLRLIMKAHREGTNPPEELPSIAEYGLCFDWVMANTFKDQPEGYYRFQLSWGGPSEEFRFYSKYTTLSKADRERTEFVLLDWYDGAVIPVDEKDRDLLIEVYEYFKGREIVKAWEEGRVRD